MPLSGKRRATLRPLTPLYALGASLHRLAYTSGVKPRHQLPRFTVSVGNLTVGGTGKTPMVAHLARLLLDAGHHPAILTRGYRGGDEARILERIAPTFVNPDRVAGAQRALHKLPGGPGGVGGVDTFLLDDGFQHHRVQRDVDLVLVDAQKPLASLRLLPAGDLREPITALRRATGVILTHAHGPWPRVADEVQAITGKPPLARCVHVWTGFLDANDRPLPLDALRSQQVAAICGLGNPQAFFTQLEPHVAAITHRHALRDHADYARVNLPALLGDALVVTSEKDWVKWPAAARGMRVVRPVLALRFDEGEAALRQAIIPR